MAELSFRVDVDGQGFAKVKKLKNDFNGLDESAKKSGKSIEKFRAGMVAFGAVAGVALAKLVKGGIDARAEIENLELQFRPLLGSAEKAKDRIEELSKFAASTPFELPQIAKASKTLETLTSGMLSTGKGLRMVGDAAAVAGVGFEELSVHVGRAFSNLQSNRAAGESISRLQELGLVSGQTRNEIEELQKAGRGKEAWEILQEELKKTEGAMEGLADTFSGKASTLADNWRLFTADFIEKSGVFDLAKISVDGLTKSIQFLSNQELEGEFDEIVASSKLVSDALKEVEEQEKKDLLRKKQLAEAEAKARADKLRNEKLALENAKVKRKEAKRQEERERKEEEKRYQDEIKRLVDLEIKKAEEIGRIQEENTMARKEAQFNEFEIARQLEEAKFTERLELLKEFNLATEDEEFRHSEAMKKINAEEKEANNQLDQARRDEILKTADIYTSSASNVAGALSAVFNKNKKLALASIALQGAQAFVNALTISPLIPLGITTAGLVAAQTGRALADASRAKAFIGGGVVNGGEQFIRVNERGAGRPEAVLNSQAVASLGGETINALNNGRIDALERNLGVNSGPQINISVNGVLSRDVYENEIKPMMEMDMDYR